MITSNEAMWVIPVSITGFLRYFVYKRRAPKLTVTLRGSVASGQVDGRSRARVRDSGRDASRLVTRFLLGPQSERSVALASVAARAPSTLPGRRLGAREARMRSPSRGVFGRAMIAVTVLFTATAGAQDSTRGGGATQAAAPSRVIGKVT